MTLRELIETLLEIEKQFDKSISPRVYINNAGELDEVRIEHSEGDMGRYIEVRE